MDRSAVFIDAGYLLAEGGKLCCGTGNRQLLRCEFGELIDLIGAKCREVADAPILRTYWYDAAQGGIPSAEQLVIAGLPLVKLRLGRLSGGRQKGVDSLIFRDLMVLASTRSIATAFLLAGDEDLREAVVYAQDVGVRVVLIGVEAAYGANQADSLVREADEVLSLGKDALGRHIRRAAEPPPTLPSPSIGAVADAAAVRFAELWTAKATAEEVRDLLGQYPSLPAPLDRELLFSVQAETGSLRERPDIRSGMRRQFWDVIRRAGGDERTAPLPDEGGS